MKELTGIHRVKTGAIVSTKQVFSERQRRMEEASMLERHIMQAQARAMSADERQLNRARDSCDQYDSLGLPPGNLSPLANSPLFHFYPELDTF